MCCTICSRWVSSWRSLISILTLYPRRPAKIQAGYIAPTAACWADGYCQSGIGHKCNLNQRSVTSHNMLEVVELWRVVILVPATQLSCLAETRCPLAGLHLHNLLMIVYLLNIFKTSTILCVARPQGAYNYYKSGLDLENIYQLDVALVLYQREHGANYAAYRSDVQKQAKQTQQPQAGNTHTVQVCTLDIDIRLQETQDKHAPVILCCRWLEQCWRMQVRCRIATRVLIVVLGTVAWIWSSMSSIRATCVSSRSRLR